MTDKPKEPTQKVDMNAARIVYYKQQRDAMERECLDQQVKAQHLQVDLDAALARIVELEAASGRPSKKEA